MGCDVNVGSTMTLSMWLCLKINKQEVIHSPLEIRKDGLTSFKLRDERHHFMKYLICGHLDRKSGKQIGD